MNVRKIAVAGVLGAVEVFLGATHLGLIPWFAGASLTIMVVPIAIGAIVEGPVVGTMIGVIFGVASLIQAAIAPLGPADVWFTNPVISVLPRLPLGLVVWAVYRGLERASRPAAIVTGALAGSLANTVLVLTVLGLYGYLPWPLIGTIAAVNGIPEAILTAILTFAVVAAWQRIEVGRGKSSIE